MYNQSATGKRLERFGLVALPKTLNGYLFHCVSVGEVVAASCLIKKIMISEPDAQITITTSTATGSARVRDIYGDTVHHFYLPFDFSLSMAAMLRRIKPKAVIITEVELWPNLIHECWLRNIPTFVVNARMTERSARRYAKINTVFLPMLKKLTHVCAQGQRDYTSYLSLGISADKVTLTNNIKFDQVSSDNVTSGLFKGIKLNDGPVIVGGSTHEPEEQVLLDAYTALNATYPNLKLILVPRHPERFDAVANLLERNNITFVRTSAVQTVPEEVGVVLLDEMGKLNTAYSIATVAFVGGSIADRGGHNALEPAAFSVPIIMGPHTYNNPVICEYLLARGALTITPDANAMIAAISTWLNSSQVCEQVGAEGRKVLDENSGAVEKTLKCIMPYVA
ncbi:3-deoxy-D-manno-octulosonic acid transferase [Alteromonas sp. A079]|uniref:3-deoxy-D-manno-octulosonic acid transferase n=1 Tax=Alteromonas sp. A079 TaxID=3410268 RepID=UPI003B9E2F5B